MDGERFDRFAATWARGVGRRSALRGAAGAAIASLLASAPGLAPPGVDAASRAKRRCRRKHGVFLTTGECRCAASCSRPQTNFLCHANTNCFCGETLARQGFCAGIGVVNSNGCSSEVGEECPPNFTCVVDRGCIASGGPCTTKADCPSPSYGCVQGRCQQTSCYAACPT